MIPRPVSSLIVAFTAFESTISNVSLPSAIKSSVIGTVIVCVVTDGSNVKVPLTAV